MSQTPTPASTLRSEETLEIARTRGPKSRDQKRHGARTIPHWALHERSEECARGPTQTRSGSEVQRRGKRERSSRS